MWNVYCVVKWLGRAEKDSIFNMLSCVCVTCVGREGCTLVCLKEMLRSLETCCLWVNTGKLRWYRLSLLGRSHTALVHRFPKASTNTYLFVEHRWENEMGRRPPAKLSTAESDWTVRRPAQMISFWLLSLTPASQKPVVFGYLSVGRVTWRQEIIRSPNTSGWELYQTQKSVSD